MCVHVRVCMCVYVCEEMGQGDMEKNRMILLHIPNQRP